MGGEALTPHKKQAKPVPDGVSPPKTSARERSSRTEYETGEACTSQSG
jgi:hypothetical protein